jgi:uncharacterized protein YkwD
MRYEQQDISLLAAELRRFSQAVIGGPHDRAADVLLELYDEIDHRGKLLAEYRWLNYLRSSENEKYRKMLNLQTATDALSAPDANMQELVQLHNDARAKASWAWQINPLLVHDKLMDYAQSWANTMAERRRMRHSSMRDIMKLGFSRAGENIAWGQKDARTVMNAWLWSPGHRRNIMSTSYTHIGCGARKDNNGRLYWCVCFGRPRE